MCKTERERERVCVCVSVCISKGAIKDLQGSEVKGRKHTKRPWGPHSCPLELCIRFIICGPAGVLSYVIVLRVLRECPCVLCPAASLPIPIHR
jgi:hypothetical protein